jgi:DNA-damage-inducible protein D
MMEGKDVTIVRESTIRTLDSFKRMTDKGVEFWLARDLQGVFGYSEWRNFKDTAIAKARMACESVGAIPSHHFGDVNKMVSVGSGAERKIDDVALTRYACYLIAMNGDPAKPEIAAAQTYFAIQTRKQEIAEQSNETESRLELRDRVRDANKELNKAAKDVGVNNYAFFHDEGYKGLYGGLRYSEIKQIKGINPTENLLDCIGRAELAANEFRITQTELRLRSEKVSGQKQAEETHHYVGKEVRQTIEKLGGPMPEKLLPEASLKKLKRARKSKELPSSST